MAEVGRFDGKVALVTGGLGLLGAATAKCFLEQGAKVAVTHLPKEQDLEKKRFELIRFCTNSLINTSNLLFVSLNATYPQDVENQTKFLVDHFHRLDILVNAIGISFFGLASETPMDEYKRVMDVNFFGVLACCLSALPELRKTQGNIVTIVSDAGTYPIEHLGAYCASKAALLMAMKVLSIETKASGVRVNTVSPYNVPPGMSNVGRLKNGAIVCGPEDTNGPDWKITPPKGVVTPEQVAEAILSLAHDSCETTGEDTIIDNGIWANNLG